MKNAYPVVTAASSSPVDPDSNNETSKTCEDQTAPIIRLKLDKPLHWDWELTTTADTVPVIQLLDRDGKLLVETTGKTAQRARGSFREGLTTYEEFPNITRSISVTSKPEPLRTGNRNMDGFSNKFGSVEFGFKPRKSRSDANIKFISNDKKIKCKQNKQSDKMSPGQPVNSKKYSTGDFLRRQILDDLRTRSTLGKTPDEVAKERCRKVKAYLRSQSDLLPGIVNSENDFEVENHCLGSKIDLNDQKEKEEEYSSKLENNSLESKEHALLSSVPLVDGKVVVVPVDPVKLVRIRSFLTDKLRERMEREEADDRLPINKRHSDCSYRQNKKDGGDYRRRKVRSETNVIKYLPGDHFNVENLSPSLIDQLEYDKNVRDNKIENGDDQTTMANVNYHSSFSSSSLYVPTIIRKNKNYHRSKSDVLLTTQSINDFELKKNKTKSSDRRRTYRKTKSDLLFFDDPYEESKKDLDRIERSWRDYKERKKLEKLQRETEPKKEQDKEIVEKDWKQETDQKQQEDEKDLTGKTKWRKDFQSELCGARNCKICQNLRISLNHPSETETKVYTFDIDSDKDHSIQLENNNNNNNNNNSQSSSTIVSPDFGYNSIPKSVFKDYRELYARSNVKKSDTFKIIDGSEDGYEETLVEDNTDDNERRQKDENSAEMISLANKSNEDIARDYFKRVYELLKKRQEEARKIAEKRDVHGYDDSSSSNYVEEVRRRKHRRRKRDTAHGTFVNVKTFILRTRFHCAKRRYLCDVANGSSTRFRNV
ncbi:PREDICTED: probable ATP-dependent helicase PF08_0048 [Polistes canadensis]|uniref:probable ATP-dependent helicase PF08_0048 n=1 Tax=Polistes canadensis TaxID=91411 RepID=UPI000718B841|nr:PREDICTED: probable ATP-dependent helicase PF08_0048 [Polistes canadensis]